MVCSDSQVGPSAFWITNPNNSFVGNMAVDVGDWGRGVGYWFVSGGEISREDGPGYLDMSYWQEKYGNQSGGLVFNPSRSLFSKDPNIPRWILRQQQARTPIKEFRDNGV